MEEEEAADLCVPRSPLAMLTDSHRVCASKAICFGLATQVAGSEKRQRHNGIAVREEVREERMEELI